MSLASKGLKFNVCIEAFSPGSGVCFQKSCLPNNFDYVHLSTILYYNYRKMCDPISDYKYNRDQPRFDAFVITLHVCRWK